MKKKTTGRLPFWKNPRFRYGSMSTVLLCVFLAIIIALNMLMTTLEKQNGWRIDMSFNALTTTGETTKAVVDSLEHPVHIHALFSKGNEDLPLMELLNRYAALSDKITWSQDDITLNPGLLAKFSGAEGDDLYFCVSINGATYTFCVESYLCGVGSDAYEAVRNLKVGDVIDLEGFLYWYTSAQPHITSVTKAA